jgi:hypothetical protein
MFITFLEAVELLSSLISKTLYTTLNSAGIPRARSIPEGVFEDAAEGRGSFEFEVILFFDLSLKLPMIPNKAHEPKRATTSPTAIHSALMLLA